MTQIKGVIFDVDGTLVDSNDAHAHAWVQAIAEYGDKVAFEKVRPLIGMGGDKVLPEVLGISKDSAKGKAITQRRKAIFKEQYLPHLKAFPQAYALLKHMHEQGLKLLIATSAEPDELQGLLQVIDPHAPDLFASEVSAKDTSKSKPDPDVVEAAIQRSGFSPDELIMIGDTPYDIEAATKAGVKSIAFRCGGWHDQDLKGAIEIYDGPADLLAHYEQSVLGTAQTR